MEFDEYDYLEKTVENPEPQRAKENTNGGDIIGTGEEGRSKRSSKHRIDDNDDASDERPPKRSKSVEDFRDNGRHKERDTSRRRSRSRDGERDRHGSSREYRDRDRGRGRSRDNGEKSAKERDEDGDHGRKHRERNRGRDKEGRSVKDREGDGNRERERDRKRDRDHDRRERDRDGERDYRKERERPHRSSSHSERHRGEYDERDGDRRHDREHRERDRSRELKEHDRENRRHKDKKDEAVEPEVDPERDQRTVFAYQISLKADERDVYEFFSKAGKVRDVRLIMDRNSRRSKGVGYIEFYDVMSVPMAIALSGQPLLGQPVMVKPSEAEKNLVQSTTATAGSGLVSPYSGGARKLYVGNLHANMTEEQLRQVFEPFGIVELVQLPLDELGRCKGFGFVQFGRLEDARNAVNLNGQVEIAGRPIKVSAVTDQNGTGVQDGTTNGGDLDDDEGGGLALNAHSRAALMKKLDRSGTDPSVGGSLAALAINSSDALPAAPILGTGALVPPAVNPLVPVSVSALPGLPGGLQFPTATIPSLNTVGIPSECLLLMNMFDPKLETEPDFELDIKEDVEEECSKYGKLKHVFVDKNSAGYVYLRFENTESAMSAQHALHGRWFAGKMITASFMVPQTYETKFPKNR